MEEIKNCAGENIRLLNRPELLVLVLGGRRKNIIAKALQWKTINVGGFKYTIGTEST